MIQIINFIKNIFKKYDSLRQESWTHCLIWFTYILIIPVIYIFCKNSQYCGSGADMIVVYLFFATPIYFFLIITTLIFGIYNQFFKHNIKNKFFTKNIIYAILWHLGIVLFLYCTYMSILLWIPMK